MTGDKVMVVAQMDCTDASEGRDPCPGLGNHPHQYNLFAPVMRVNLSTGWTEVLGAVGGEL